MDKIVVDSNILFSAILNLDSNIGQILINEGKRFDFYAPKYARTELLNHKNKILKITGLTDDEFLEIYDLILKNVILLNHSILPKKDFKKALAYCQDIDPDDTIFVAFSEYLNAKLWTGDNKLIKGLKSKGFNEVVTTKDIIENLGEE